MSDRIAQMDIGIGFDIQDTKLKEVLNLMDRLRSKAKTTTNAFSKISMPDLTRQNREFQSNVTNSKTKAIDFSKAIETITNKTADLDRTIKQSKTKIDDFTKEMQQSKDKAAEYGKELDRSKNKTTEFDKTNKKASHTLRDAFSSSIIGNAVTNIWSNVGAQVKNVYTQGMEYNGLLGKIDARFKNMGFSDKFVKQLDKQVDMLKYNTNMDDDQAANVQAKMLNWSTIGNKGGMKLAKTIGGISDSSKLDGQAAENLAGSLMRVGATGKVSYSALNRVTKSAPTFYATLAKGAGMSENNLKSLLRTGNVTQKQFQTWMASASKYSDTAFTAYGKTQGGAISQMKKRWVELSGMMTQPLFDAKSSGLQALKDLMSSKELSNGVKTIGNGISDIVITLDKHKSDISSTVKSILDIGSTLGKDIWKDFSTVFIDIGQTFGLISRNSDKSGNAFHSFAEFMDSLAKNKTAIELVSKAIVAMFTIKAADKITKPFRSITGALIGSYGKNEKTGKFGFNKGAIPNAYGWLFGSKTKNEAGDVIKKKGVIPKSFNWLFSSEKKDETGKIIQKRGVVPKLNSWLFGSEKKDEAGNVIQKKGIVPKAYNATKGGLVRAKNKVSPHVSEIWSGTKTKAGEVVSAIESDAKSIASYVKETAWPAIKKFGSDSKDVFSRLGDKVKSFSVIAARNIADFASKSKDKIKDIASNNNLFGQNTSGKLTGVLQSAHSAGGFKGLTTAGKVASGAAIGGSVIAGGAQIYSAATKDKKGSTKKYSDIGGGLGSAIGGGLAGWFLGPEFAPVGAAIGKAVGKVGGKAVHKFQDGWNAKKPPKSFWSMENLGWSTHDTIRKVVKAGKDAGHSLQKGWKSSKPPKKFWSLETLGWAGHQIWNNSTTKAAITAVKGLQKGWTSKKPPKKFWSLENLGWSAHNMFDGFMSKVKDVIKWFKDQWNGLKSWFGSLQDKLHLKGFNTWLGKVGKGFSEGHGFSTMVGAHAQGSSGGASHFALVGEAGTEIGYQVNSNHARLLGANGPEIVKVRAGENILPAGPSSKVLNGGLGQGMTLPGYAKGKGTSSASTNNSTRVADKYQTDELSKNRKFNKSLVNDSKKYADTRVKNNKRQFDSLEKDSKKSLRKLDKQWNNSWTDITHDFKKILNRLPDYTQDAMNGVIGQLNKGFKGINSALGQFGGNDHVLSMIHYADGTDKPVEKPQLAVLNDSPRNLRQETIVHANGSYEFPQGNNVVRLLHKGDSVLNGEDTLKAQQQGILPFYASGKNSHSALRKLAKNKAKNYQKGFDTDFSNNVKVKTPRLQQGVTTLGKNAAKPSGQKWYQAMYSFISSLITDGAGGSREAFLNYAKEHFSGKRYVMGATGPDAYDCSGMVSSALSHFGINIGRTTLAMQDSSGVQSLGHDFNRTVPGDLVIYGHGGGAAGHVGIINSKANNTMFNETPPSARVTSIDTPKSMGYEYFRIKGLHNASAKTSIPAKLTKLVKSQLGSKAINWIKNNLSENALGGNINLTGDISQRARSLAKALMGLDHKATKNGIAAILGNWFFESRLDSSAVNSSGGASGLGQWLGGRLSNLRAFAKSHGTSWSNPAAQLKFALSGEGSDSSIFKSVLEGHGSVASLANKFSSQWERGGYNAQHVNGAMQVAKSLRGLRNGGHVKAGETVQVNEDGIETFRPDVSGTVIPHAQTIKNIKNNSRKSGNVTVNQKIEVHATGNNATDAKAQVKAAVDQANVALIEKLQELMGFNDDGGVII